MALTHEIDKDYIEAYKSKDERKVATLRLLKSAIKNTEIEKKTSLNDDETVKIIQREVKQRNDSLTDFEKGGRTDLADQTRAEIEILKKYMPEQLSDDEIDKIVKEVLSAMPGADIGQFGQVMSATIPRVAGKADGSKVSEIVRNNLK